MRPLMTRYEAAAAALLMTRWVVPPAGYYAEGIGVYGPGGRLLYEPAVESLQVWGGVGLAAVKYREAHLKARALAADLNHGGARRERAMRAMGR